MAPAVAHINVSRKVTATIDCLLERMFGGVAL
jgi:hypothetical protein